MAVNSTDNRGESSQQKCLPLLLPNLSFSLDNIWGDEMFENLYPQLVSVNGGKLKYPLSYNDSFPLEAIFIFWFNFRPDLNAKKGLFFL